MDFGICSTSVSQLLNDGKLQFGTQETMKCTLKVELQYISLL